MTEFRVYMYGGVGSSTLFVTGIETSRSSINYGTYLRKLNFSYLLLWCDPSFCEYHKKIASYLSNNNHGWNLTDFKHECTTIKHVRVNCSYLQLTGKNSTQIARNELSRLPADWSYFMIGLWCEFENHISESLVVLCIENNIGLSNATHLSLLTTKSYLYVAPWEPHIAHIPLVYTYKCWK